MAEDFNNTEPIFTVIDIETTGVSSSSEIIEIAAVKVMPDLTIDQDNVFDELICPKYFIDESSVAFCVNKISNQMVRGKPQIEDVMPRVLEFIGNSTVVGHNVSFDLKFINAAADCIGLKPSYSAVVDTLQLARKAYPKIVNHKLDTLIDLFEITCNIDPSMRHRALYDAMTTAMLFTHLVGKLSR